MPTTTVKTGEYTSTFTASGTLTVGAGDGSVTSSAKASNKLAGLTISAVAARYIGPPPYNVPPFNNWRVTVSVLFNGIDLFATTHLLPINQLSTTWSLTITGTVEEYATFDAASGVATYDATVFEKLKGSTTLTGSVTISGFGTVSRSTTVTAGGVTLTDTAVCEARVLSTAGAASPVSGHSDVTGSYPSGWTPPTASKSGTYTSGAMTITAASSTSGSSASADLSITSTGSISVVESIGTASGLTDLVVPVDVGAWRLGDLYPHSLDVSLPIVSGTDVVAMSGGNLTTTRTYKHYSTRANIDDGSPVLYSAAQRPTWLDLKITRDSLNAAGESTGSAGTLSALLLRGPRWEACTLTDAGNVTFDDGTTLSPTSRWAGAWSAGGGGSVAIASGAVTLTGPAGKTLSRTLTSAYLFAWPKLRIRLRCSAASHTITVAIGSKHWKVATGAAATWTSVDIDLGAEHNGPAYSDWQTEFTASGEILTPSQAARSYAGASGTITLSGLGAGDYEIDYLEVRCGTTLLHWLHQPRSGGILACKGVDGGHPALELWRAGSGGAFPTILGLGVTLPASGYKSRWEVTYPTTLGAPGTLASLLSSDQYVGCLWGFGYYWDGGWSAKMDANATSAGPQMGQLLLNRLMFHAEWAGWPDPAGGFDGPVLAGALGLGYGVWGRVLTGATRTPASATTAVTGTDYLGGATNWSGSTDGDGAYRSGSALLVRSRTGTLTVGSTVKTFSLDSARWRLVLALEIDLGLHGLSLIHTASGQLCLASERDTGAIRFRRAEYPIPVGWVLDVDATDGTADMQPALFRHPGGRLGLLFSRDPDVYEAFSDDEGATWSEPAVAFTNATTPSADSDANGALLRVAICADGGGFGLKGTYQAMGDASPSAVFTLQRWNGTALVDLRVEELGLCVKAAPYNGAPFVLSVVLEGDTDTTDFVSYDEGRTWQ
jgi:hypothetical protein